MEKRIISSFMGVTISCLFFGGIVANAAPSNEEIQTYKQPSGEKFKAQLKGDEFLNYVVTDDGNVIEQGEDGYWYYTESVTSRESGIEPTQKSKLKVAINEEPKRNIVEDDFLENNLGVKNELVVLPESKVKMTEKLKKTHNTLVVLVDFNDVKIKYSEEDWHRLAFGNEVGTLKDYYRDQTLGEFDVVPATESYGEENNGVVKVSLDMDHPNTQRNTGLKNQTVTQKALIEADQYIDYSKYDSNNNGRIENDELHFIIVAAGQENSAGYYGTEPKLHGHRFALYGNSQDGIHDLRVTLDGKVLNYYTQIGEKHGDIQATVGIVVHEFGHDLGLPDLYNTGYTDENDITHKEGSGLSYTSVMASGSWGAKKGEASGSTPVGLDAYSKEQLGLNVEEITKSTSNKLVETLSKGTPTVLRMNTENNNEYFLIENRQLEGYDQGMERGNAINSGGIAVYRVNKNYTENQTVGRQLVTILEADESSRGYSYYDRGGVWDADPFYYVGKNIHEKEQEVRLSKETVPTTQLSDGTKPYFSVSIESESQSEMYLNILYNDDYGEGVEAGFEIELDKEYYGTFDFSKDIDGFILKNFDRTTDHKLVLEVVDGVEGEMSLRESSVKYIWQVSDTGASLALPYKYTNYENNRTEIGISTKGASEKYPDLYFSIRAAHNNGVERYKFKFVKEETLLEDIEVSLKEEKLYEGQQLQVATFKFQPSIVTNKDVKIYSDNETIFTADGSKDRIYVTGKKKGKANLIIEGSNGIKKTEEIEVIADDYGEGVEAGFEIELDKEYYGTFDFSKDIDGFILKNFDRTTDHKLVLEVVDGVEGEMSLRESSVKYIWQVSDTGASLALPYKYTNYENNRTEIGISTKGASEKYPDLYFSIRAAHNNGVERYKFKFVKE